MLRMQKIFLWMLSLVFIAGVLGYAVFVFSPIISHPQITINTPQNGEIVSGTEVIVRGETKNISKLYLNGSQLTLSRTGNFESRLAIWEGHTILTLTGYDRFGRSVSVSRIIGTK